MNLFSEVYNSYYQILQSLLKYPEGFTLDDLKSKVKEQGFEESLLYLIPKLSSNEWRHTCAIGSAEDCGRFTGSMRPGSSPVGILWWWPGQRPFMRPLKSSPSVTSLPPKRPAF